VVAVTVNVQVPLPALESHTARWSPPGTVIVVGLPLS